MAYSHILWDFNGTLLDDVETGIVSINALLKRRGMPLLSSKEDYHRVFRFPISEYYQAVGFDFSKEAFSDLAVEWMTEYLRNVVSAPLQNGAKELLRYVQEQRFGQILLSATEFGMLQKQAAELGITSFFDEILGLDNIHAESKIAIALAWKRRRRPRKMLMIGDTDHDAQTAQALGADCVLLSIGHQSRERLSKCGVPVVSSMRELYPYIRCEKEAEIHERECEKKHCEKAHIV